MKLGIVGHFQVRTAIRKVQFARKFFGNSGSIDWSMVVGLSGFLPRLYTRLDARHGVQNARQIYCPLAADVVEFHDGIVSKLCGRAFCFRAAAKIRPVDSGKIRRFLPTPF